LAFPDLQHCAANQGKTQTRKGIIKNPRHADVVFSEADPGVHRRMQKKRKADCLFTATGGNRFCLRPENRSTKELVMATMNPGINERRHIPDRRISSSTGRHGATRMNALDWVTMVLMIIGGLNWGLVGLFNFDLVATLFGQMSALSRIIYVLVGLSALYSIYTASKMGRNSR
jgi:hypothetical protein